MKYDVTRALKDHRGDPLPTGRDEKTGKPLGTATLRDVLETLCLANTEAVKSGEDKLKVYRILQRTTVAAPMLTLEASEVELIKKIAAVAYPPSVYGMLVDVLEAPVSGEPKPDGAEPAPAEPPLPSAAPDSAQRSRSPSTRRRVP